MTCIICTDNEGWYKICGCKDSQLCPECFNTLSKKIEIDTFSITAFRCPVCRRFNLLQVDIEKGNLLLLETTTHIDEPSSICIYHG